MNLSNCMLLLGLTEKKHFSTEISLNFADQLEPFEECRITENVMKDTEQNCALIYFCQFKLSTRVKVTFLCCLASPATITICVAINGEYRTGSEVDSLWVQASVAEDSALPWKIEHLGASWRTSLPCCATTTQVPTGSMPPPARGYWTKAGQMVPLPTYQPPLRTAHCPLPCHSTWG